MEKLTEDVLINIFIRLPAKQLFQMRCVCKPWNAFLRVSAKSSYFIKSHLNHSNSKDNEIVLAFNARYTKHAFSCTVYDLSQSPIIELNDLVKLPRNFPQSALINNGGHVIGSVNGLICFYVGYCDSDVQGIYIWNPSLSVVMILPPFDDQERLTDPTIHTGGYRYSFCFGFGFDPKTDDYKVVKFRDDNDDSHWWGGPIEVYSMKKGSWEFIDDGSFPVEINIEGEGRFVDDHDGHLYFLCYDYIAVFDLGVESSFSEISLPDSVVNYQDDCRYNGLGMLDGKLCVVSYTLHDGKFEVWVMNEYGVARDTWVKSHVLSKLKLEAGKYIRSIGFTLNNKFIFAYDYKGLLGCYDQETDKVTYFGSDTSAGLSATVVPYVDSLVWYASPTD